jgi:hypothetical protein
MLPSLTLCKEYATYVSNTLAKLHTIVRNTLPNFILYRMRYFVTSLASLAEARSEYDNILTLGLKVLWLGGTDN